MTYPATFAPARLLMLAAVALVMLLAFVPVQRLMDRWSAGPRLAVRRDVAYWRQNEQTLTLDVARPKGKGKYPALVFIHGGAWRIEGNAFRNEIFTAANNGYVAVRIHYRLLDLQNGRATHPFPAQIEDLRTAIHWLQEHADEHCIDPRRIALVGMSAGGQLALLAGLDREHYPDTASAVRAVVNYYGPTDLLGGYKKYRGGRVLLETFLAGTPDQVPTQYELASPINFVNKHSPPVLTFHGDEDEVVPLEQAQLLDERMQAVGAPHRLVVLRGESHGFRGRANHEAQRIMYEFLDEALRVTAPDAAGDAELPTVASSGSADAAPTESSTN